MYHGTLDRAGVSTRHARSAGHAEVVAASLKLDGAVYASPIVVGRHRRRRDREQHRVRVRRRVPPAVEAASSAPRRRRRSGRAATSTRSASPARRSCPTATGLRLARATAARRGTSSSRSTCTPATIEWHRSIDLPGVETTAMQERGALTVAGGRVWVPVRRAGRRLRRLQGPGRRRAARRHRRPDRLHRADHPRGRHLDAARARPSTPAATSTSRSATASPASVTPTTTATRC